MRENGAKDISSTERLLELIRSGGSEAAPKSGTRQPPTSSSPASDSQAQPADRRKLPWRRTVSVGIEITTDQLLLAKVAMRGKKTPQLLGYHRLAVDPAMDRSADEFVAILRSALNSFIPHGRRIRLWTGLGYDQVEIRNIRVPKVPPDQLARVVEWTARKQAGYDPRESLLDFEPLGEVREGDITKLAVLVCLASRSEVRSLRNLFQRAGYPLSGITIAPYAIENLIRAGWFVVSSHPVAHVCIDREHSRIDLFEDGKLQFCRVIKTGIRSMEETLADELEQLESAADEPTLPGEDQGEDVFQVRPDRAPSSPAPWELLQSLDIGPLGEGEKTGSGTVPPPHQVMEWVTPALERLAKQIERTFDFYTRTLGYGRPETLYVSGFLSASRTFRDFLGDQIGVETRLLDPLDPAKPIKGNVLSPAEPRHRVALVPATGLALSDNRRTLNLLFNYAAKSAAARARKLERKVFAVFLSCVLVCLGLQLHQQHRVALRRQQLTRLHQQLDSYRPLVDEASLAQLAARYKRRQESVKGRIHNLEPLAVVREVAQRTPRQVRLIRLKARFGAGAQKDKGTRGQLDLEGLVLAKRQIQKGILSGFLLRLSDSPLFGESKVESVSTESFENLGEVLHFNINLDLK